jgi:hypothetical protein
VNLTQAQHDYWQTRVAAFGAKSAPDAETLTALQQSNTELARTRQHNQQLETQVKFSIFNTFLV